METFSLALGALATLLAELPAQVLTEIVGDAASAKYRTLLERVNRRLLTGEVPIDDKLASALTDSLAGAALVFAYTARDPERALLGAMLHKGLSWTTFSGLRERISELVRDQIVDEAPADAWLATLIHQARNPASFDKFQLEVILGSGGIGRLAHPQLDHAIRDHINREFLQWLPPEYGPLSAQAAKPADFDDLVTVGIALRDGRRLTYYDVFMLFFREEVKQDPELHRVYVRDSLAALRADTDALIRSLPSVDERQALQRALDRFSRLDEFTRDVAHQNQRLLEEIRGLVRTGAADMPPALDYGTFALLVREEEDRVIAHHYPKLGLRTAPTTWQDVQATRVEPRIAELQVGARVEIKIAQTDSSSGEAPELLTIDDLISASRSQRFIMTGEPGAGKTACLCSLVCEMNRAALVSANIDNASLALFVDASRLASHVGRHRDGNRLDTLIAHLVHDRGHFTSARAFAGDLPRRLRNGQCLIAVDGLDEVGEPRERTEFGGGEFVEWLARLCREHPGLSLVASTRNQGFTLPRSALQHEFRQLRLLPMTYAQMLRRVRAVEAADAAQARIIAALAGRAHLGAWASGNPLLLTLFLELNRLTAGDVALSISQATLYEQFLMAAAAGWNERARLRPTALEAAALPDFAAALAFELWRQGPSSAEWRVAHELRAPIRTVRTQFPEMLLRDPLEDLVAAGILLRDGRTDSYRFTHATLGAFLVARELARRLNLNEQLWEDVERLASSRAGDDIIPFAAGLLDSEHAAALIAWVARDERDDLFRHRLALAARCLPEIAPGALLDNREGVMAIARECQEQWMSIVYAKQLRMANHLTRAIAALLQVGNDIPHTGIRLLQQLYSAMTDSADPSVQMRIADGFDELGSSAANPRFVGGLISAFLRRTPDCLLAARVLRAIGEPAAHCAVGDKQTVIDVLSHTALVDGHVHPILRSCAISAFSHMGEEAATPQNIRRLGDLILMTPGSQTNDTAAPWCLALGRVGRAATMETAREAADECIAAIMAASTDRFRAHRIDIVAFEMKGAFRGRRMLETALRLLESEDPFAQRMADEWLGRLGKTSARWLDPSCLPRLLRQGLPVVRGALSLISAARTAAGTEEVALLLLDAVSRLEDLDAYLAARALGRCVSFDTIPSIESRLSAMLTDAEPRMRARAAQVCSELGSKLSRRETRDGLLSRLADADWNVKCAAISAVAWFAEGSDGLKIAQQLLSLWREPAINPGTQPADDLRQVLHQVRMACAHGLARCGQHVASIVIPQLVGLIENEETRWTAYMYIADVGASAMTPEVVKTLATLVASGDKMGLFHTLERVGPFRGSEAIAAAAYTLFAASDDRTAANALPLIAEFGQPDYSTAIRIIRWLDGSSQTLRSRAVDTFQRLEERGVRIPRQ